MKPEQIAKYVNDPEFHKTITAGKLWYSLGVTLDPNNPGEGAIRISIMDSDRLGIPQSVPLVNERGVIEDVPVLVRTNTLPPRPL